MTTAARDAAMAEVLAVQVALAELKKNLKTESDEDELRKCVETIEAAEPLAQGLIDFLKSR
jgi:hypothetical protein